MSLWHSKSSLKIQFQRSKQWRTRRKRINTHNNNDKMGMRLQYIRALNYILWQFFQFDRSGDSAPFSWQKRSRLLDFFLEIRWFSRLVGVQMEFWSENMEFGNVSGSLDISRLSQKNLSAKFEKIQSSNFFSENSDQKGQIKLRIAYPRRRSEFNFRKLKFAAKSSGVNK